MEELPEVLTRLSTRLETLESRVYLLEHPSEALTTLPAPAANAVALAPAAVESSSFTQSGATFAVLGKAMLGMAGAYLLRAVAESGSFPKLAVIALAIAYAGMWLVWAVRVPADAWFASTTYAATSALILAPMLWELTLRFHYLSPSSAAAGLAIFVIAAGVLAWIRNLTSVVWVVNVTAAIAAIALLIATREMLPFIAVLLMMSVLSEIAAGRNHWLSVRPLVAAAVDFAICSLVFIYSTPQTSHADYHALTAIALLAPAILLLLIYGTSVAVQTLLLLRKITLFEAGQAVIAFALAATAVNHFGPAGSTTAFGAFCLLLAPACYAAAFLRFDAAADSRNTNVFATWGIALLLTGSFVSLPPLWLASCLGIAAIAATFLAVQRTSLTLEFHGLVYLIAAAFTSGLLPYAAHALAGAFPAPPGAISWTIAAAAVLCYAIAGHFQTERRKQRLIQTVFAILAMTAVATTLVSALVWLMSTMITPGESHVAVIRTLTACTLALALAFLGPHWQRIELVWVAYGALALIAAKLLFEDLRQGHPEFIAASIFLYAVTLILVPRVARRSTRKLPTTPA